MTASANWLLLSTSDQMVSLVPSHKPVSPWPII
ncbi:hypothetical protein AJ79_10352 [Helicocarpus griseus UAMH5409]|uniref:Uncharacterized protein n=1 Tax=Helicocarpus griseus UAMH5409 TaxID=1447875 RepID=A0A2B7WEN8_9EURO|nr:hypothetical protein AJ79_10352 [Helicocarpus griseus UAMH5409]